MQRTTVAAGQSQLWSHRRSSLSRLDVHTERFYESNSLFSKVSQMSTNYAHVANLKITITSYTAASALKDNFFFAETQHFKPWLRQHLAFCIPTVQPFS